MRKTKLGSLPYGALARAPKEVRAAYYTFGVLDDNNWRALPEPPQTNSVIDFDPIESVALIETHRRIAEALQLVPKRSAMILRMLYGLDDCRERTIAELAAQFDVTEQQISAIKLESLRTIKHPTKFKSRRISRILQELYD